MAAPSIPSGTRLKCSRSMRRRSAPISLVGLFSLETTPLGDYGQARTADHPQTDERATRLELGCEGNSPPNQAVGVKTGFCFHGDKLEGAV